ncbi:MAG: hypothetical protein ACOH2M_21365 [Cypionkella sp.]
MGDLLSQPLDYGGLGLGTVVTSFLFLAVIAAVVLYMSWMNRDGERVIDLPEPELDPAT